MFYALDTFSDPPQVVAQGTSVTELKKDLNLKAVAGTTYTVVTTNGMSLLCVEERNIYSGVTINRTPAA
jgi:hypothetical protein